ncbi:MAG: hypothetical protein GW949_00180 [Spirochaetales bacterium]|nr:hypothetical protein [Spirochaetales bacterium]
MKDEQRRAEDLLRLTKGRPTKGRIGSRAVAHRLRTHEHAGFRLALERGFLEVRGLRKAILNSFTEYKHTYGQTAIIHEKTSTGDWIHWNPPIDDNHTFSLPGPLQGFPKEVTPLGFRCGPMSRPVAREVLETLRAF